MIGKGGSGQGGSQYSSGFSGTPNINQSPNMAPNMGPNIDQSPNMAQPQQGYVPPQVPQQPQGMSPPVPMGSATQNYPNGIQSSQYGDPFRPMNFRNPAFDDGRWSGPPISNPNGMMGSASQSYPSVTDGNMQAPDPMNSRSLPQLSREGRGTGSHNKSRMLATAIRGENKRKNKSRGERVINERRQRRQRIRSGQ